MIHPLSPGQCPRVVHHTTKYDGSLHYRFRAELVYQSPQTLILYRPPGISVESYRGGGVSRHHMLLFYHRSAWHNTLVSWRENWTPHLHYVNIATPAEWSSERVSSIDLDLDVFRVAGTNRVVVDDEDEFAEHTDLFRYPADLVARCRAELSLVCSLVQKRRGPYSDRVFMWRPGSPLDEEFTAGAETAE